jgi:c-di-GMP-binding flagellar brake protein YcgR
MAHSDPPSDMRPANERRRSVRIRLGPLRVRLHRTCEGFLVDISATGALVQLPTAQTPECRIKLHLEWNSETLEFIARVVRSTPHRMSTPSATLMRNEYQVAVEFSEIPPASAAILARLLNPA